MKKSLIVLALLSVFLSAPVMAQRVVDYSYSFNIDLLNSDTATHTQHVAALPIANKNQPHYEGLLGYVYVPDCYDLGADTVGNAGVIDTAIITYYTTVGLWKYVIEADTASIPCTSKVEYWMGDYVAGSASDTADNGYTYVSRSTSSALYFDNIYVDVFVNDSSGSGAADSLRTTPQAWFRLIERNK